MVVLALTMCWDAASAIASDAARTGEFSTEVLHASDVDLLQLTTQGSLDVGGWDTTGSLAVSRFAISYEPAPFDFQGVSRRRAETNAGLQLNGRRHLRESWTLLAGAGAYDGPTNYRSLWLDEYFHQQYANLPPTPGFDTYRAADPGGWNLTGGLRWAYRPGSGFAQLAVSFLRDDIAPGYEIDFAGLRRGRDRLDTIALNGSFENVLSPGVRSLVEMRAVKTTERDVRLGVDASVNIAAAERWITRLQAGATTEDPRFDAWYLGATIEYAPRPALAWFATVRRYADTGEIENALLFTSAAPALHSTQFGIGVRRTGESWSWRVYAATLRANYAPTNPSLDFFQNLYRDRDWTILQAAIARRF